MSEKKKKRLNQLGQSILRKNGISMEEHQDYDWMRSEEGLGYAHYYLQKCWNESELINKADVAVYKQLLEIDSKLGTTQSEQLFECVFYSLRMDLIKV